MNRLGVPWSEATTRFEQLSCLRHLRWSAAYTHLATADEPADALTAVQLGRFRGVARELTAIAGPILQLHMANSAALLRYPETHFDLVRPGLALYGVHPCPLEGARLDLRPVMSWKARLTSLRTIAAGEPASYGATWCPDRNTRVAVAPCGYADGYLRSLSNEGEVLVRGHRCPVVGRVTMDQTLVDVSQVDGVSIGDEITLFGPDLPVEVVARKAGTIPWELLCAVSQRVTRVYRS